METYVQCPYLMTIVGYKIYNFIIHWFTATYSVF